MRIFVGWIWTEGEAGFANPSVIRVDGEGVTRELSEKIVNRLEGRVKTESVRLRRRCHRRNGGRDGRRLLR